MKVIVKVLIFLWDKTLRQVLNWIYNAKWNRMIRKNKDKQLLIKQIEYEISQCTKPSQITALFRRIFPSYKGDPLSGVLDNSSSWTSLIAKMDEVVEMNRDCDDMAVVMKHLGEKYCELIGAKIIEPIDTFSWAYTGKVWKAVQQFHVMALGKVKYQNKEQYILFDYTNVVIKEKIEDIYQYYIDSYLIRHQGSPFTDEEKKNLTVDKMVHVRLIEPKSYKLK